MKLTCPPKNTSPKFAHRVTRISALMKMISARNASRCRTRHSNPQSAFRNPKFSSNAFGVGHLRFAMFYFRIAAGPVTQRSEQGTHNLVFYALTQIVTSTERGELRH